VRVAIANATLALGDGTNDIVVVSGAAAYFVVTPTGLAGQFGGTVTVNVPDVSFSGEFTVQVNNTGLAINEQFNVGNLTARTKLSELNNGTGVTLGTGPQIRSPPAAARPSASISPARRPSARCSTRSTTPRATPAKSCLDPRRRLAARRFHRPARHAHRHRARRLHRRCLASGILGTAVAHAPA
jgi:hypothetical protein